MILSLFSNYMSRLGFELNGHSRSEVLEVATCHSPVWCWMNTWRDLEGVEN